MQIQASLTLTSENIFYAQTWDLSLQLFTLYIIIIESPQCILEALTLHGLSCL